LRKLEEDLTGAADAMSKSVEHRRYVAMAPQLEGPGKYHSLARSLRKQSLAILALGDKASAGKAMAESNGILRQIGTTLD
jgi:hypothetical protein